jgi:hypothetical protein
MHKMMVLFCGIATLMTGSLAAALPAPPALQTEAVDAWIAPTTKVQFEPQRAADAPLQLDLPKKDWMVLPSSGSMLLILASRKGDAVVLLERLTLNLVLEAADITDLFAQIEIDAIKKQQPKAAEFQSRVLHSGQLRLVAVQYGRPGVLGSERVRQYSIPIDKQLYHVTCISSAAQFGAYDPVFSHIAASFKATR